MSVREVGRQVGVSGYGGMDGPRVGDRGIVNDLLLPLWWFSNAERWKLVVD